MARRYSDEELLEELHRLHEELDRPLKKADMDERGQYHSSTYRSRFGGWPDALREAGLTVGRERNVSEEQLLNALRDLYDELGHPPRQVDMSERGPYAPSTYHTQFGSWNDALTEADIPVNRNTELTDDKLIAELQRLHEEHGKVTKKRMSEDGTYGPTTYQRRFGSWTEALRAANLPVHREVGMSDTDLIEELNRLHEEHGKVTSNLMEEEGEYGATTYQRRFGSWTEALEAAGLPTDTKLQYTDEELLAEIDRLAEELGHTPRAEDMDEMGEFSSNVYSHRWGSWNGALSVAGREPYDPGPDISDEELLAEVDRLAEELGERPSVWDMAEMGEYGTTTYERRFGSWDEALEAGGYDMYGPIPEEELLSELERLYEELGRVPIREDMNKNGEFSEGPYDDRFGTFNDALREVGLKPRERQNIPKEDLISDIQNVAEQIGRVPFRSDMDEHGRYSSVTFTRKFDSWASAVREAGYEPPLERDIPREALIAEVKRLVDEGSISDPPRLSDMGKHGRYSESTYIRRFGKWENVLEETGKMDESFPDISKEDVVAEIQRLYDELDRVPTARDMTEEGKYSSLVCIRRYGRFEDAVRDAGYDPSLVQSEMGDSSNGHYGPYWEDQRVRRIAIDEYQCRKCGCTREEHYEKYGRDLSVHHIERRDLFDSYAEADRLTNLITLCRKHHRQLEGEPKEVFEPLAPSGTLEAGKIQLRLPYYPSDI